ncbi:MAG: DsbA family oxidoreductase, partial [Pseudomonadota bacterium]
LETKFGGRDNAIAVYSRIAEAADAAGVDIDFEGIKRTPNTLDAHRLIHWAGLEGRQTAIVSSLFRAYFKECKDIGTHETLLNIAEYAGMDRAMTERLLQSDADADDIRARDVHARERGVTGVPTFVVGNQHVVPGAQPTDLWVKVLNDLANPEPAAE